MTVELGALIILAITNFGTLGYLAWHTHLESKDKSKTINALIAKNSQEYLNHEMADKTEKIKVEPVPNLQEDMTEVKDLSNDEFAKYITPK